MSEPEVRVSELEVIVTEPEPEPTTFAAKHPFVIYTGLRLGLLLIAGVVCYALGARGILLLLLAFVISGLASFILLVPQRDRVGVRVGDYFRGLNDKIEESKRSEDDIIDEHNARQSAAENDADRQ